MVQGLHDPHFSEQFLQTPGVQLGLVDDLDGHLLTGGDVFGKFDLGKVSLADSFEKSVLPDVGLLPGPSAGDPGAGLALETKQLIGINNNCQQSLLADYLDIDWVIESFKKSGYHYAVALVSYKNHFIIY